MARRGEFERIADLLAPLAEGAPGAFALTDDAAVVPLPAGCDLVVTKDAIVEGVHYLPDDPPDLIGRKLMRVNLSDLAAMGARPVGILTACAFPPDRDESWIEAFVRGLAEDVRAYACPLLGGDTVSTPGPASFSLTALGAVPQGTCLRRAGAREGDLLVVSGTVGDAALGLRAAQGTVPMPAEDRAWLIDRYRLPRPRLDLGRALLGRARAALDVSDGLMQDAGHLLAADAGLAVEIAAATVPLSPAAARLVTRDGALLETVVGGGDDYELLFAWPAGEAAALPGLAEATATPLTVIGRFVRGRRGVTLRDAAGAAVTVATRGWRHGG
jgi:thiamine-monophosphate kinase